MSGQDRVHAATPAPSLMRAGSPYSQVSHLLLPNQLQHHIHFLPEQKTLLNCNRELILKENDWIHIEFIHFHSFPEVDEFSTLVFKRY